MIRYSFRLSPQKLQRYHTQLSTKAYILKWRQFGTESKFKSTNKDFLFGFEPFSKSEKHLKTFQINSKRLKLKPAQNELPGQTTSPLKQAVPNFFPGKSTTSNVGLNGLNKLAQTKEAPFSLSEILEEKKKPKFTDILEEMKENAEDFDTNLNDQEEDQVEQENLKENQLEEVTPFRPDNFSVHTAPINTDTPSTPPFAKLSLETNSNSTPNLKSVDGKPTQIFGIQTPRTLASLLGVDIVSVLKKMIYLKEPVKTSNDVLSNDLVELICAEFGYNVECNQNQKLKELRTKAKKLKENNEKSSARCPMVVIMGHINHGKTTLLDAFRGTNVVDQEAGGITQRIAAFQATMPQGLKVTFLDTPGHEAFSSMRTRGVRATDIAILVVAADEGVKEQTVEAIQQIKESKIPSVIVALNKVDKHTANVDRVKRQLLEHFIVTEDFGGEIPAIPISAQKKTGLQELSEAIEIQAGLLDLRCEPGEDALASVLECKKDPHSGVTASVVVRNGSLKVGDCFVTGSSWGKVRKLRNDRGESVERVLPGEPAEVIGFKDLISPGEDLIVVPSEQEARELVGLSTQHKKQLEEKDASPSPVSENGTKKEINVILKADCGGSLDALKATILDIPQDEVLVNIVQTGVGPLSESDLTFAQSSASIILGFNVNCPPKLSELAKQQGIEFYSDAIIYNTQNFLKEKMDLLLKPNKHTSIYGSAEIQKVFEFTKGRRVINRIAGCVVTRGTLIRGPIRVLRNNEVVYEGKMREMKHLKQNVSKARNGTECGVSFSDWEAFQEGDIIQSVLVQFTPRKVGQPYKEVEEWVKASNTDNE